MSSKRPRVSGGSDKEPQKGAKHQRMADYTFSIPSPPSPSISEHPSMAAAGDPSDFGVTSKSTNLRGRKRFLADLEAVQRASIEHRGLRLTDIQLGEEEGTFNCRVSRTGGVHVLSLNFLVSDTSEYPSDHVLFCYSSDEPVPEQFKEAIDEIPRQGALSLRHTLDGLLTTFAKILNREPHSVDEEEDQDEEEDVDGIFEDYDTYSEDNLGITAKNKSNIDMNLMQRDFNEMIVWNYRPGYISFGTDEFILSVSLPVVALTRDIPARALMAWDRRLLSQSQHLTMLISGMRGTYPVLERDGILHPEASMRDAILQFRVGLTPNYKPTKQDAMDAVRVFRMKQEVQNLKSNSKAQTASAVGAPVSYDGDDASENNDEEPQPDPSTFQSFSLSASLESLMNDYFLRVMQLRLKYDLGWAGAEMLCWQAEKMQQRPEDALNFVWMHVRAADEQEAVLQQSYNLPPDPLLSGQSDGHINLPLLAFCYLIRRLMLCSRYCIVCHDRLNTEYETLKPYVCDSRLCTYQYYFLNRGLSLEYEIRANPEVVDLLVSLAFVAAREGALDNPLPIGMGLRVANPGGAPTGEPDSLCDFDTLTLPQMQSAIANLIQTLPPIADVKKFLDKHDTIGKAKPRLHDMNPQTPSAAWLVLRWCIASCTAHVEELSPVDCIQGIDSTWRQFRFSIGAPDVEARFKTALKAAQNQDPNALDYPALYAFHGSPLKNWHSIIRHGLWYKTIANGRAYGDGVYFSKEGSLSMQTYARTSTSCWSNSSIGAQQCCALAEIVNLPQQFVRTNPFFVVKDTEWIMCRYLLVKSASNTEEVPEDNTETEVEQEVIPFVPLDPRHPITMSTASIRIPDPSYKLVKLLEVRQQEQSDAMDLFDEDDMRVFDYQAVAPDPAVCEEPTNADDWVHDAAWVNATVEHLLPPPSEATPQATMALQKELKSMLREQEKAKSLRELGWYMPPDLIGDNLFQWIVELHSFEKELPIAKDMEAQGINSIVFEIRFPPSYPHAPPFFRILKPRFLPFIRGGGGHVTGGGSMCMDLLTADGWLPSYSISAILLQIKLAISNLDPRPARLASNWDQAYNMNEALEGYKRAANTHGWKIPQGLERLALN
ncbi:uncharacterized protein LAESUDRAFT_726677 [Laetiporus sulphureus 93-53]|uniref:UBC core domain-containing protein n=1 Tax=Laetiporus sulphureus 93-53 TaxID=1314785 RepID=A0A165DVY3_9APHY|nr:uncharacterized protein LAESUDRAFT_726677 [Laetiporus sulphureus 93-53]KZT05739.1 hypothetical protein LAESUDRAFT_726677 [Laetiporus sulphureus 93-53]